MQISKLTSSLRSVRHFRQLPISAIREIVQSGQTRTYTEKMTIFREGEPCAGLLVLIRGRIHLYKCGIHGQEAIISVIHPIIMFNEVAALDGGDNPITAIAAEKSLIWQIKHVRFNELIHKYPPVGTSLLKVLAQRNRLLMSSFEDIFSRPVRARVARVLLDLSAFAQIPINRNQHTNLEIAAMAATVPEAVSRTLQHFREDGLIHTSRIQITLLQVDRLVKSAMIEPDTTKV
jgi:CRP/FNR family cyclic AMP-dependent transcriptional regulator